MKFNLLRATLDWVLWDSDLCLDLDDGLLWNSASVLGHPLRDSVTYR